MKVFYEQLGGIGDLWTKLRKLKMEERLQITDEDGNIVQENISSKIFAESYLTIYEREGPGKYKIEPMPDIILDI